MTKKPFPNAKIVVNCTVVLLGLVLSPAILHRLDGVREGSSDYATAVNNLTGTYRLMGRLDDAEWQFQACLELYHRTVGEEHILYYHAALNAMGLVCYDGRRYQEALDWFVRAAQVAETLYGREHRECQAALRHAELARQVLEEQP